jgi:membrane protein YdbS with pleckstrin-like domain
MMTQADPQPVVDDRPHRPADDSEEVYFEGSPLLRAQAGRFAAWIFVAIVLVAGIFGVRYVTGQSPWWLILSLLVLAVIAVFVPVITTRTVRYRITNYRIDYGKGLLARDTDTMELWHVEDLRLHQGLLDRMLGVGTIIVYSHDDTTPQLHLQGLPTPEQLFNLLKQRVIAVKRQRGVLKMDPGQ